MFHQYANILFMNVNAELSKNIFCCSHPKRYLDEGQIKRCGVHETTKSSKNLRCYRQDGKLYPSFQPKVSNISKNVHQITGGALALNTLLLHKFALTIKPFRVQYTTFQTKNTKSAGATVPVMD